MAVIKSGASTDNWTIDPTPSNAGRVTLYDASGNAVSTITGLDSSHQIPVTMTQNVWPSVKNSTMSASILASPGYWEGATESTLGVAGVQVNTFLTQAHTITLYQSMNGTDWDITDIHDVPANYGYSITYQATAANYKVRVTNKSVSTATGRIQTALCPVVECLPRALTRGGNLKVSVAAEWQSNTRTTGVYSVCSPRTIGLASAPQNLFVIQNPSATYWIAIRSLNLVTDCTTALLTISPIIRISRATAVSGGTSWTANISKYQTSFPSPQATCLADTTADDAALTTITATAGTPIFQQVLDRQATNVGLLTHNNFNIMPDVGADLRQIILAPGENLLVQSAVTASAATFYFLVNCSFSEMLAL
jgi:hypothetical protein